MELLTLYVKAAIDRGLIDEWHVWDFARTEQDREWLKAQFPLLRLSPSVGSEYFPAGVRIQLHENAQRIEFNVSATNDAHIGIAPVSGNGPAYEIVLGGWSNTRSVVRAMPSPALFSATRSEADNRLAAVQETPGVLPEYTLVSVAIEISVAGISVFVAGKRLLDYQASIQRCDYEVYFRSGHGCNAEWQFPHWPESGAFLFRAARNSGLQTDHHHAFKALPVYLPFYQHYGRQIRRYSNDLFIKCDDDIVFFDLARLSEFIEYRRSNPQYFMISANVINNGVCAYFQQKSGLIPRNLMNLELPKRGIFGTLWESAEKAESLHHYFTKTTQDFLGFRCKDEIIEWNERISVNFVSWLGSDFAHVSETMLDDEEYLSYQARWHSGKPNSIFTSLMVSHLSFGTQEKGLDIPKILEWYRDLARDKGVIYITP
jgi:hypothetical protein